MNIRLITSVAMSTVIFATHARSDEMPGELMGMTNDEMLVKFRRDLQRYRQSLEDTKDEYEDIKELEIDIEDSWDTKSFDSEKQKIKKMLDYNLRLQQFLTESIEYAEKIISMLEAFKTNIKMGQVGLSSLSQEEQINVYNDLEQKFTSKLADINKCKSIIASYEDDLEKYKEQSWGFTNSKQKISYNQQICKGLDELIQLTAELSGIGKQTAHLFLHGSIAPNPVSQPKKWSNMEKVLIVLLCNTVFLGLGIAVRFYMKRRSAGF